MNQLTSFRLLIGRNPTIRPAESDGETPAEGIA
jgi:hypothetical protein